jgi:hypothetical protein
MRGTGARAFVLALILSAGVAVIPACNIAPDPDQFALEILPILDNPEVAVFSAGEFFLKPGIPGVGAPPAERK